VVEIKITEESLSIYEKKVLDFICKYEMIFNKIINTVDHVVINFIEYFEKLIFFIIYLFELTGLIMRYSTFPLHWIWIKLELNKREDKLTDLPLFKLGAHYIYGKPSAGKSTLIYHATLDYAYYTGKTAYTTEMMETVRTDVFGKNYYYHQLFSPSDFFKDGVQVAGFESDRFNMIVYEEMLTKYQQRNNAKKSYNDEVLPMIASMGTQRHQGIDLFYFISQLPRNDIAIMQMLIGYHEPQIKKAFDYKHWLNTGKFRFYIKGWTIKSSEISLLDGYNYKLVNTKRWWYPNKYPEQFKYFNRLNMKDQYDKLEKYKGVEMQA